MSDPRLDIVKACREVFAAGLVVGRAGNINVRLPEGRILITPAGASLGSLTEDELAVVTLRGGSGEGGKTPSTEFRLHLAIYRARPDIGAVVHTHSTYATVVGYLGQEILDINPETKDSLGEVGIAPAQRHGTQELAEATVKVLGSSNAVLLKNHGAVTVGASLLEAVDRAYYLEQAARLSYLAGLAAKP